MTLLCVTALVSIWIGYRGYFRLEKLTQRRVVNAFLILMAVITVMTVVNWLGVLSQRIAADITGALYVFAAGFFLGYGAKLYQLKRRAGSVLYINSTFLSTYAPALISVMLVAFGVYRTNVLTLGPFTLVGITSGLSLIAFGIWGWTVSIVPEFRKNGILLLDQHIPWKRVISYEWIAETTLEIDYFTKGEKVSSFRTFIPEDERLTLERILAEQMEKHDEERKEVLAEDNEL